MSSAAGTPSRPSAPSGAAAVDAPAPRDVRLYVIPGSHACRSAMLMLEHKRIAYRLVELPTGPHPLLVRVLGFPGHRTPIRDVDGHTPRKLAMLDRMGTVPALRFGSERVQTNLQIARFLERVQAEPALFPADPERRRAVEQAERWGDETLQMAARRITIMGAQRGLDELHERGGAGRLGPLLVRSDTLRAPVNAASARMFQADARAEGGALEQLPAMLDQIDAWIADGVLDGPQLNAADFMIAPSIALLAYRVDLREQIEARPAGALVERVLPQPASRPR
jgi:glutathione S-transferase